MVDLTSLTAAFGDKGTAALFGLVVGSIFGASAQRSAFCLRAATIEFWRGGLQGGALGPRTAVWGCWSLQPP